MSTLKLGSMNISHNSAPYIIAEIGVNHEGSMELAKKLIELAKEGGAHAAKFQSYKAEKIAARKSPSYWDLTKEKTTSQYELFKKYDGFGPNEYLELAKHCEKVGIDFLSTPFDDEAVDFLDPLMPFFKIASADITNTFLLKKIASKNKPIVISTGASRIGEIDFALNYLKELGVKDVCVMHCVLNYPTQADNAHLNMISHLQKLFPDYVIGYSDHTPPDNDMWALNLSYTLGARVIEKHFTHDKSLPGNDHYHAMTTDDLKIFWKKFSEFNPYLGFDHKSPIPTEKISRLNARRSLVLRHDLKAGHIISEKDLIPKRPATGISPIYFNLVDGAILKHDLQEDHILEWKDIDTKQTSEKVVIYVQARMGSKRFPQKMMAKLNGRPVIHWVLKRLQESKLASSIVLLTSKQQENSDLISLADELGIASYAGSEENVLSRFTEANKKFKADLVVRVCADNPFIDPQLIDQLIQFYKANRPDYAFNHVPKMDLQIADGFGAEIFSSSMLDELSRSAYKQEHLEHVTSYIWEYSHAFNIQHPTVEKALAFPNLKFDLDTREDLAFLEPLSQKISLLSPAEEIISKLSANT